MKTTEQDIRRKQDLLKAFGGSVEGWNYVDMTDAGPGATQALNPPKCPCGHPIRYICNWEHTDGRKTHTGNVCVHTIPELSGANTEKMEKDLQALKEKEKATIKAEKEIMEQAEVKSLWEECLALNDQYNREGHGYNSYTGEYNFYTYTYKGYIVKSAMGKVRKLKTAKGKIKKLNQIKADLTR